MRKFLSQFLSAAQIDEIEKAFKEKNPDSTGLPVHISKTRLDEEIGKRKTAEDALKVAEEAKAKAIKEATDPLEAQLKEIPKDWKAQLEAAKAETTAVRTEYEGKLAAASKTAEVTAKIYESGARNVKAVRALLDESKDIDEQLKGLKKSDGYLFRGTGLGKGTGRDDDADPDDPGTKEKISEDMMYRAVGIEPPVTLPTTPPQK